MAQNHEENERYRVFARRALLVGGAQLGLMSLLAGRMYYLQVVEADRYKTLAEDNRINLRLLPPPRGQIVDRFGRALARNQQNFRVVLVREHSPEVEKTLDLLGEVIELSDHDRKRVLRDVGRRRGFVPVRVRDNLTWAEVARVEVHSPDLPGISIEAGETRDYPFGEPMAHAIGYVAAVAEKDLTGDPLLELPGFRIGKSGTERQYDLLLRGTAGTSQIEVNAFGRVIRELNRQEGKPGNELVLTLDTGLQGYVHQRLMSERSAAAVVMDVQNGDVLALSSVPSYDPNLFNLGISNSDWAALNNNPLHPLTNKSINGNFAPGSTFKMVVALAAMEAGISPAYRAYCPGFMKLGNAKFHCWKRPGHGWLEMTGAIQQSCDVFFYDVARKVGVDKIAEMARRLGLGAETGIDLPHERGGTIPTKAWKEAVIGEAWQGGETLITAIGQGFVLTTPLQLATMTARLATGRAVVPRLARGIRAEEPTEGAEAVAEPQFPSLGINERYLSVIHKAMDLVINHKRGTAHKYRIEQEGWEMAGKTGTSQVRRISLAERRAGVTKNEQLPWRRRDHGLFVCFAPIDRPRYACAVVIEHGGGSKYAAPVARDIMLETQRRDPAGQPAVPLLAAVPGGDEDDA